MANFDRNADWGGQDGHLTTVGGAGPQSESYYGCADLGGNVYEWTDTIFQFGSNVARVMHGGNWIDVGEVMRKDVRFAGNPTVDTSWRGARVVRLSPPEPGTAYCFGVGCPCGNDDPAAGCAHSGGQGASLSARGTASVAADDLRFDADQMPANTPALLFAGVNQLPGLAFGDGLRCAGGSVRRLGTQTSDAGGSASFGPGLSAAGGWSAGETRYFQVWYRDVAAFCTSDPFNLSQGAQVDFQP